LATKLAHIREATYIPQALSRDESYLLAKRLFDIVLAAVLLVLLSPVIALVALAVALDSPGPVVFKQKRVLGDQELGDGRYEQRVFEFYKFRSMYHNADQKVHQQYMESLINGQAQKSADSKLYKLDHDTRITRVGRILRKTSLDELPQLFNILRGEMSFVGPRPAIPYEVQQYKPWHLQRLTVTQGLTGLWQVKGRNERSFDEMVALDIEYVRKRSFWLDVRILLETIPAVLSTRGVR
jgi:lipopolysaccharide/colanic/teichoic acid biosynthesis glycosyltransferase